MDIYEKTTEIDLSEYKIKDNLNDRFIDGNLEEDSNFLTLIRDIESNGVVVPLIFARKGEKELELISGRRRLMAIKALNNALREEEKPLIQIIPVKIIKQETPSSKIYQIAYSENSLRTDLSTSAKVEAMFLPLFNACNSEYTDAKTRAEESKRNFEMEHFLKELKSLSIKVANKRAVTERELFILEKLKELALVFNNMPHLKMLNSIAKYKLSIVEKRLIIDYGLKLRDLLLCKKTGKKRLLDKIKEIYINRGMKTLEKYETLKSNIVDFDTTLSAFYKIADIDNNYNAEVIGQIEAKTIAEWSDNLMSFLCEKLQEIMQNYKDAKKEEPKAVISKEINALIKTMDANQMQIVKAFIEREFANKEE